MIGCFHGVLLLQEMTLMTVFAGHETTGSSMSALLRWLWKHPEELKKVRQEQQRVVQQYGEALTGGWWVCCYDSIFTGKTCRQRVITDNCCCHRLLTWCDCCCYKPCALGQGVGHMNQLH